MEEKQINLNKTFDMRWRSFKIELSKVNSEHRPELDLIGIKDIVKEVAVQIKDDDIHESSAFLILDNELIIPGVILEKCRIIFDHYFGDYHGDVFHQNQD